MKLIYDKVLISTILEREQINSHFASNNLNFHLLAYSKGELLTSPQKPLQNLLFVVSGSIRVYGIRQDGSILVLNIAAPRNVLGEVEFCRSGATSFFIEALTDVLCAALPIEENRAVLEQDPVFLRYLLQQIVDDREFNNKYNMNAQTLEEKVIIFLRDIQPDHTLYGVNSAVDKFRCSRRQLQRVLSKLCDEGTLKLLQKGRYVLVDDSKI